MEFIVPVQKQLEMQPSIQAINSVSKKTIYLLGLFEMNTSFTLEMTED
jgi:hypothetical protein